MAGTLADQALRFTRRRSALRKGVSRGSGAGLKQPERRQVRTITVANLRISAETAKRFALIITTLTFLAIFKSPSPPCHGTYFRRRRNGLERGSERRWNSCFRPRRESQNNAWKTGATGRVLKIQKNICAFFAKQQVAKHAHMINEQSAKRSALKGQPVHSPGQRPGYQCKNAYAL